MHRGLSAIAELLVVIVVVTCVSAMLAKHLFVIFFISVSVHVSDVKNLQF